MPTFNSQEYLRAAIESVLIQTHDELQLIIVDDGSSDDSVLIASKFYDSRIEIIESDENKGQSYQLNKGIGHSKGEYICIMHSDDIMYPTKLERQLSFLQQHPGTGVCGCNVELIGQKTGAWVFPEDNQSCKDLLLSAVPFAHPAVMIRKSVLNHLDPVYNTGMAAAEDYDLWVRLADQTDFGNVPETLLKYRLHPAQQSVVKKKEEDQLVDEIRMKLISRLFKIDNEKELAGCFNAVYYPDQVMPEDYLLAVEKLWSSNKQHAFFSAATLRGRLKHSLFKKMAALSFREKVDCFSKHKVLAEITGFKTKLRILFSIN